MTQLLLEWMRGLEDLLKLTLSHRGTIPWWTGPTLLAQGCGEPCTTHPRVLFQPTNTTETTAMCVVVLSETSWLRPLDTPCCEVKQWAVVTNGNELLIDSERLARGVSLQPSCRVADSRPLLSWKVLGDNHIVMVKCHLVRVLKGWNKSGGCWNLFKTLLSISPTNL